MQQSAFPNATEISRYYRISDVEAVGSYLKDRPELVALLLEARPYVERIFGGGVVVDLRLAGRLENDFGGDLLAMIQCHIDADEASSAMDRLWDDWWLDASGREAAEPLYIGVEYAGEPVQ